MFEPRIRVSWGEKIWLLPWDPLWDYSSEVPYEG